VYAGGLFASAGADPSARYVARWGTVFQRVYLPLVLRGF
jgi:hypothetical protein